MLAQHGTRRSAILLMLALWAAAPATARDKTVALKEHDDAVKEPFDEVAFQRWVRSLPRDGERYIVEGDIALSERELRPYLVAKSAAPISADARAELIVNRHQGQPDYWHSPADRKLTFAVDRSSFPAPDGEQKYRQVVQNVDEAGRGWSTLCPECGVDFKHLSEFDASPSFDKVRFIVRYHDASSAYLVLAFFPHTAPSERFVNVDPSYFFTSFDRVGVFRHELGHVLGYRHEQKRDMQGCYQAESKDWLPLTPYDPHSVMHYFCPGGGTMQLAFTDVDKRGHQALYGAERTGVPNVEVPSHGPCAEAPPEDGTSTPHPVATLEIRFEGGEVADNVARAIRVLHRRGVLELASYDVVAGDTVCGILQRLTKIPGACSAEIIALANELNQADLTKHPLAPGQRLFYPRIEFADYVFTRVFDPEKVATDRRDWESIKKNWHSQIETQPLDNGRLRVLLKGYRTSLPLESEEQGKAALAELAALESRNILYSIRPSEPRARRFFASKLQEYYDRWSTGHAGVGEQGSYAQLFGMDDLPPCAKQCTGPRCPEVVLIDTPVSKNPDIAAGLVDCQAPEQAAPPEQAGAAAPQSVPTGCERLSHLEEDQHGTYMASIIGSRDNGFGFIGMSPAARLCACDGKHANEPELGDLIERKNRESGRHVFVFASTWEPEGCQVNGPVLTDPQCRFKPIPSRKIKEGQPLWIMAAGQSDSADQQPIDLRRNTAQAPMNLGDLRNVIVVTACVDCFKDDAKLWPQANFSLEQPRLVHVAAPGTDIPGWATDKGCTVATGTSQATALVGGVVAAMISCYPDSYLQPDVVKTRLQVTSRPALRGDDAKRIASGIVDPRVALLDPAKSWLLPPAGDPAKDYREVTVTRWCTGDIYLRDEQNQFVEGWNARVNDIYRIVRSSVAGGPPKWTIYRRNAGDPDGEHVGEVIRIGPGMASGKLAQVSRQGAPPVVLSLDQIDDLILSNFVKYTDGQPPC